MSKSPHGDRPGPLVDLSLDPATSQPELPLEPALERPTEDPEAAQAIEAEPPSGDAPRASTGSLLYGRRWTAAGLDLGVHLAVLLAAAAGSWSLGVPLGRGSLWPLVVFLACFSFVYHVVPLTFWGQTPGMAAVGLISRDPDGKALTIHQAGQRWLGSVLNVLTLGVVFLAARRRSLPDLLSRSRVLASEG